MEAVQEQSSIDVNSLDQESTILRAYEILLELSVGKSDQYGFVFVSRQDK